MKQANEASLEEMGKALNKALIEIFGKDLPKSTNIYSQDK